MAERVTENEIAFAIVQIAMQQDDGVATLQRCKREIPLHIDLSAADRRRSQTRPNEPMWHQLIRNIKSHSDSSGNYICEGYLIHLPRRGYQVTDAGRRKRRP